MSISERARRRTGASAALIVSAIVACASERDGDQQSVKGGNAGASGDAGEAGSEGGRDGPAAGEGGSLVSQGGSGRGGQSGAAGSEAGSAAGGASGSSAGSEGGEAGADSVPEWPREGDPCFVQNYSACPGPQASYQLVCNGTTWELGRNCGSAELCDRLTGACSPIVCGSGVLADTCEGPTKERVCGPDRVTSESRTCEFTCRDMLGCVEPAEDEVYVDRPRDVHSNSLPWPDPLIPICLADPEKWESADLAAVHDAFYRTWARHTAVRLTDFAPCTPSSEGIVLDVAKQCNVELARISRTGYPGPAATLPVTLCTSYLDSGGNLRGVGTELFEFAVVHIFGHVFGYPDVYYPSLDNSVMTRAIKLGQFSELSFDSSYIATNQIQYGMTPSGSLGGPSGHCLSAAPTGEFSRRTCDGSMSQTFRFVAGRLEYVASGECLRRLPFGRVGLGDCTGAESWEARRVSWLALGGECVSVKQPADALNPLVREPCHPSRLADQTFSFEFPAPGRARIRLERDGRCVRWPDDLRVRRTPELGDCDGVHDLFETIGGGLGAAGRCLDSPGNSVRLEFAACAGGARQRFGLSGPLENQTVALTAVANGDTFDLGVAASVSGAPSQDQIFDYYF
jgi:hypothetical protein